MLSQQNCVVIFIESDTLRYCVRKSGKLTSLIQGESLVEYQYQDLSDIEMLISDWQKTMPKNTTFKVNIDITQIQMQSLALPGISLTLNEVVLFVESSLYKLFQLSAKNIFFDFIHESAKTRKKSNVIVAICERDYIDKWIGLFAKYDLLLQFVGCIINEQQTINFLPWRQEQRRKHKFQLSRIAISYISLMICLFCYLFIQAQNTLETYTNQISKQQIVEQQLMSELSNRLPHSSPSQQQVYQFLLLLSMQLPSSIWLESFHYLPQKITIIGNSFTYPDITLFSHDLLTQIGIKNNQIQSVSIHNNFLLFEMDIELNVP